MTTIYVSWKDPLNQPYCSTVFPRRLVLPSWKTPFQIVACVLVWDRFGRKLSQPVSWFDPSQELSMISDRTTYSSLAEIPSHRVAGQVGRSKRDGSGGIGLQRFNEILGVEMLPHIAFQMWPYLVLMKPTCWTSQLTMRSIFQWGYQHYTRNWKPSIRKYI